MKQIENQSNICRSVFKSDEKSMISQQFTKKWIDLINKCEKDKTIIRNQS